MTPKAHSPKPRVTAPRDTYVAALKMLARRDLSEAQVRQRLKREGYDDDAIDEAVARLREERAIDDARVAEVIARTETAVKRRGRRRVRRQLEAAGIAEPTARRAVDELFGNVDEDALLEASLAKRLRGGSRIVDEAEFRRLYRYLVAQGFDPDRVISALDRHKGL